MTGELFLLHIIVCEYKFLVYALNTT